MYSFSIHSLAPTIHGRQSSSKRHRYLPRLEQLEDRSLPSITLSSTAFFGGAGDQRGTAIAFNGASLFLSGNPQPEIQGPAARGLVVNYPLSLAVPNWSRTFDYGTNYFGIAATSEGVYPVGWNYSLTTDPVGGKEVKSIITKFNPDGSDGGNLDGSVWYRTPNFFSYSGVEAFQAATTMDVGGTPYVYAAGGGQPFSYYAYTLASYDTTGNLINWAIDPFALAPGRASGANGVATLNNNIYAAGYTSFGESTSTSNRPTVWKYNASLDFLWQAKDTSLIGNFNGVTSFGGNIYAVGFTNVPSSPGSEDYLIQKFDEAGNRLWSANFGGANVDILTSVVGIGSKIYAAGYTQSAGAGAKDMVVFEIDPANGNVLSTTYYGGALDDQANGVTTDGTYLYVVGESKSFANGGNAVGQNDVVVLKYTIAPFGLQSDPLYGGNMLVGNGTPGNDNIFINALTGTGGGVSVYMSGTTYQYPASVPISRIVVYGGEGNDYLWAASNVPVPVWLFGQGGDDKISGGAKHDVLVGGTGNDIITGNGGHDLMFGGMGVDRLTGGNGDDLLIGAYTSYDAVEVALKGIMDEWTSGNSYETRVANLRAGTGMTGGFLLQDQVTVFDDNALDDLTGMSGRDWYFAYIGTDPTRVKDRFGDLAGDEFVDPLS